MFCCLSGGLECMDWGFLYLEAKPPGADSNKKPQGPMAGQSNPDPTKGGFLWGPRTKGPLARKAAKKGGGEFGKWCLEFFFF